MSPSAAAGNCASVDDVLALPQYLVLDFVVVVQKDAVAAHETAGAVIAVVAVVAVQKKLVLGGRSGRGQDLLETNGLLIS